MITPGAAALRFEAEGIDSEGAAPAGADQRVAPMRFSTIAITFALAPVPALPFDHDEFCAALNDVASRMNARKGRWLDRSTRHDGVKLNCELQALELMRFVNAEVEEMRPGWEIRRQREWNAHYCNHESWREAIDAGWSIISTLTFRAGEQISFVAECQ